MSIFDVQFTEEQKKQLEFKRISDSRKNAVISHIGAYETALNDFWNNSILTPQEICNALGSEAIELFQASELSYQYIKALMPSYERPSAPMRVIINEDGTATIAPLE